MAVVFAATNLHSGYSDRTSFTLIESKESSGDTKFNIKLPDGVIVVIDARKLGPAPDYKLTVGFVDQFDPHSVPNPALEKDLTPAQKKLLEQTREARRKMAASTDRKMIDPILKHLEQAHKLTETQVSAVRDHCIKILAAPEKNSTVAPRLAI